MTRTHKRIQVSGAKGRHQASLSLADILPAALLHPPLPPAHYLELRQLSGKRIRINLTGLRLNIYRPQRAQWLPTLATAA